MINNNLKYSKVSRFLSNLGLKNLRCTVVFHSEKAEVYEIDKYTKGAPIHPKTGR